MSTTTPTAERSAPKSRLSDPRLFPFHLTPFENYMVADDRADYPMTFAVQFDFSGSLEPEKFRSAVDEALGQHPLLRALIRPAKSNRDCWVDSKQIRPMIHFGPLSEPLEFPGAGIESIDLHSETGLRIWIRHDNQNVVVTTQFHHAVCDGIGAYQFLGDVLASYAQRCEARQIETDPIGIAPPMSLSRFRNRGRISYDPTKFMNKKGRIRPEWKQAISVSLGRNVAIRPSNPIERSPHERVPFPGVLSFEFDKNDHRRLRLAAQSRGQMINDLLLEKLFQTLDQWNQADRSWLGREQISVMMPLDLREPDLENISACNVVTYAFIRRNGNQLKHPDQLRQSLGEEISLLKHQRHQTPFMNLVNGARQYPRVMQAMLARNHCMATAIMSNTGDPTKRFHVQLPREQGMIRSGNLLLTGISGVPPMRIKTRVTISIFTYRRVLKICLRCDPNLFRLEDTQLLLDQYVEQIKTVLD